MKKLFKNCMKFKLFTLITVLGMVILASSCAKEGCTDPDATNFDADAKDDDNTCQYEGKVVFWQDELSAEDFADQGVNTLYFYIDGELVGSSAANVYWSGAPDCGTPATITFVENLGSVKNKSYTYSVTDEDDFEWYSGVVNITANTCTSLELD